MFSLSKNTKILLLLIVLLSLFLRFWSLGTVPASLDWDEVAYGYNAYSILHTGRDEYGVKFPVILRSYNDYKPALYSYLAIPEIAILGLTPVATRMPDAIFSVIAVLGTFFLVRKIFKREDIALLSSFFLAVSPWHIQFSRFSHEAVIGVTLNILAVLFLMIGLKKPKFILFSAFFLALSFYSYQSEKLFAPLLALLLLIVFFKDLLKVQKKYLAGSFLVLLIIVAPMLLYILHDSKALSRAKGTSIFSHQTEILSKSANQLITDKANNNIVGLVTHNRRIIYGEVFAKNYIVHFDPRWIFFTGDIPRHHPPGMGILYLFDLPFLIIGTVYILKSRLPRKYKLLIFGWILIAPIPAAFTYDVPHAARTLNALPIPQIIAAVGVVGLLSFMKEKTNINIFRFSVIAISAVFIVSFSYYFYQYFYKLNYLYSSEWQYGYKEAVASIEKLSNNYDKVIVSDKVPMDQSYMFFLYYLRYPPKLYQREGGTNHGFGKFEFREIDWSRDSKLPNSLILSRAADISSSADTIKTVDLLNGKPIMKIVSTSGKP